MQDRYVGDIGDFAKYSLLNNLSAGLALGVAWYLYPSEDHNSDGKHTKYLDEPQYWRHKDPCVFDGLKELVSTGKRATGFVVENDILRTQRNASERLQCTESNFFQRAAWRKEWFNRTLSTLSDCPIVFADPDNGFCLDEKFRYSSRKDWKRLPLSEANKLAKGRTAIFYHHNTRMSGGHDVENQYWMQRLEGSSFAIKFTAFSVRSFFVLNASNELNMRALHWCNQFGNKAVFQTLNT